MNQAMTYPAELGTSEINLTAAASTKMAELMQEADPDLAGIRVFVSGGGCGGMEYGLTFVEQTNEYDRVLAASGYKIFVDPIALNYLQGCQIDYQESGVNASFVFNNVFQAVGGSGACGGCGGATGGA